MTSRSAPSTCRSAPRSSICSPNWPSDNDLALILVSHDLGVVRYLCDDVLVLHDGSVVESGRSDDVLGDPQHDYTRKLVAAVPRLPS